MKIVLIGANGQLGSDIAEVFSKDEVIGLTHTDIEVKDLESVSKNIIEYKPDIVINTAAFHNVPECEKNDLKAFEINAIGAKNLAIICKDNNLSLLHISTDYIFDGKTATPYTEDSLPNPLNVYGITKLAGEHYIRYILPSHFIVRTSGLYGTYKCRAKGENFVDKMIRFAKEKKKIKMVTDEILTPTYTLDLANQIKDLIKAGISGTYHITNEGSCSWYEFTIEIFSITGFDLVPEKAFSDEIPSPVKRPKYSVLENKNLKSLKINNMRTWREALKSYLKQKYG